MFRHRYPAAWTMHQNTVRWPFNVLEPDEESWAGAPFKEYAEVPIIALPPASDVVLPLAEAIRRRVSCRSFVEVPLALADLSAILSLAYGLEGVAHLGARELLERPVPSGGGLYPLELYILVRQVEGLDAGVYHYAPLVHAVEQVRRTEFSNLLASELFMNQPYLAGASAILLIGATIDRSMHKYGERGYRYILLEAGHTAQNVCLTAASLGLGALPLGGFFDGFMAGVLGIDLEEEPLLYGIGVGHPATTDRTAVRGTLGTVQW